MKFLERALIILYLLGLYFIAFNHPRDPTVILFSAVAFSVFYLLCMPLLLQEVSVKGLFKKDGKRNFTVLKTVLGVLFGLASGYFVFAIAYHQLGKMDNLAILENGGILVILFAVVGFIGKRKGNDVVYKNMLIRTAVFAVAIACSILLKLITN